MSYILNFIITLLDLIVKIRQFDYLLTYQYLSIRNENGRVPHRIRRLSSMLMLFFYGSVQHDLETCQRPRFCSNFDHMYISKARKLKMNDLKRPKYRDILSKSTKNIGRDEEDFKLHCLQYSASFLKSRDMCHKKVSLTYFHFQGVLRQLLLGIVAKHCDL